MKLEKFITQSHKDLTDFQVYWLHEHRINPLAFPLEMAPEEFQEQFELWKGFAK